MFPQVINDLFRKSTLSGSLAAHDTSSSRKRTSAACALIPSKSFTALKKKGAVESFTQRSTRSDFLKRATAQLTEFPKCILRHALSSQSRICLVVATVTGPEGEGQGTW
ncbi:hypothetical protein QQF64_007660 [Cirrhinus molitorella]|uniref:Uncharacterized protein n=1 Tax=Cirrhinus molitorella TaxID=172907 RepID=A0ABR3MBW6_9TELE